jgi:hypothetical protein
MNVTFSTGKTEVKFKRVNYFKQNMTRDAFVLHIAKSQEFVVFFMSCRFSIKSEPEIWQHRNRGPPPPLLLPVLTLQAVI